MERRLAAILAADVAGYSRLMGADEAGTLGRLKALHKELVKPSISGHKGRVVKLMGDGLLAEFTSVVEAVQCAADIQEEMVNRELGLPADQRIELRIGINLGDVIVEGADIYGDGVNIAARLESICLPGGIAIPETVNDQITGKLAIRFENLGPQQVKNISRPLDVWQWLPGGPPLSENPSNHQIGAETVERPSIAVLPFKNLSSDPEQDFFADGVSEAIITGLSRFRWLTTIARGSSFAFRNERLAVNKIAQELGSRYLLEGSVRRAGNRVRVTAQLIEAISNKQLWADNFDGDLENIFELQDDITHRVSASLQPEIEKAEWKRLQTNRTTDLNAWELYLKGIWHFYKHTERDSRAAIDFLSRAIGSDDNFGQAYAALAYAKFHAVTDGYTDERSQELQDALKLAQQAIELDDQDAFAHFVLGRLYSVTMEHDQAISELEFAIKLNPSLADAYHGLGFTYTYSGEPELAIPLFEKAFALSPHDPNVWAFFGIRAAAYIEMEYYEDAIRCAREAVKKRYAKYWAFSHLTSALGHADRTEDAQKAVADLLARKPDFTIAFAREHLYYYRETEKLEHYLDGLRNAGVPED